MRFVRLLVTGIAVVALGGGAGVVTARAASSPSAGASVTVCATGCTYTTIAHALTAAVGGEFIKVGAGSYAGGFVIHTPVTIQGANRTTTIISGGASNNRTVVEVEANPVTISGVTITGRTWSSTSGETGGGVVVGSGVLNLKNCYITDNQGNDSSGGGGISSFATTNIIGAKSTATQREAARPGRWYSRRQQRGCQHYQRQHSKQHRWLGRRHRHLQRGSLTLNAFTSSATQRLIRVGAWTTTARSPLPVHESTRTPPVVRACNYPESVCRARNCHVVLDRAPGASIMGLASSSPAVTQ